MIDLILMNNSGISENEISLFVDKNRLQTNSKAGALYYDNEILKLFDGFYLRIETGKGNRLKLECSLHKYFNHVRNNRLTNFDIFSISNSKNTIELLTQRTGIELNNMLVTYYEIGLNLYLTKDCINYIDKMQTIGILENKKPLYVNPKYKNERLKTTVFHRDIKKVHKVYDKVFEMKDKKRTDEPPEHPNILRIETTQRRIEKTTVSDLLKPQTINKIIDQFLKDWRTVQFDRIIEAPKGTHQRKIDLINSIIKNGCDLVLSQARESLKTGNLTEKRFRDIREFIQNDWQTFKESIKIKKTTEEKEFREVLEKTLNIAKN